MADTPRIAVIGGGWAGIAAAVELVAAGRAVTLFEAGRVLGGRARTITLDGRQVDNGQHILLGAYRDTLALMRQIGADPDVLLQRQPLWLRDNAGFELRLPPWPAPFNLAAGLLTAKGVGWREKLATARWMQGLKWQQFRLARDTTVADWLTGAGQTSALRRHLWAPLCLAALNTPVEHASAQVFANTLRDSLGSPRREDTDLLLPRVPLGQLLPEPAWRWLRQHNTDIRFGCRVHALAPDLCGVRINGEPFAAAILATAPQHAAKLLGEDCPFAFEPIGTVYLTPPAGFRLPCPMLGLQGRHGQWVIQRDDRLMAGVFSGHGEWENLDDRALLDSLATELGFASPRGWHGVVREKRATFSCRPGLNRPQVVTALPGLWRAGDYTWADYPGTLEGAVRSGLRAARAILEV